MSRYWENETPITITTGKNVVRYYRDAEKLSIARSSWTDKDGKEMQGKTVTLDIAALTESGAPALIQARDVFETIIEIINGRLELIGGA